MFNEGFRWIEHIKHNLQIIGMSDIWNFSGNGFSNTYVKNAIKLRIKDIFQQNWHEMKSTHSYCPFYDIIKTDWKLEKYLTDLSYQQRVSLCKFRCRSNFIPVASSRFTSEIETDDHYICPLCNYNCVGDEFHYLFKCPFFEDDRKKYLDPVPNHPDLFHASSLFNSGDRTILRKLADFVDLIMKIFEHRDEWEDGI